MWQNGTPHSMQRAPCADSSSSGRRIEELLEVLRALVRVAVRHADALDLQERPELDPCLTPTFLAAVAEAPFGLGAAPLDAAASAAARSASTRL